MDTTNTNNWEEWRQNCKQQLDADQKELLQWAPQGREEFKALVHARPPPLPPREERVKHAKEMAKKEQLLHSSRGEGSENSVAK